MLSALCHATARLHPRWKHRPAGPAHWGDCPLKPTLRIQPHKTTRKNQSGRETRVGLAGKLAGCKASGSTKRPVRLMVVQSNS
jgi:hypothetical protein